MTRIGRSFSDELELREKIPTLIFLMIAVLLDPRSSQAALPRAVPPTPLMLMQDEGAPTTVEAISEDLAEEAQKYEDMVLRHNAVNALSSVMTNAATTCLVRVAAREQETKEVRLQSLTWLEQQTHERQGFEELIPTLKDRDPDVKGMAAIILSIEYADEPPVLESLSVTESLVEAALNAGPESWIYLRMVERLETIAHREFVGESDEARQVMIPCIRAEINNRIIEWTKEMSCYRHNPGVQMTGCGRISRSPPLSANDSTTASDINGNRA